MEKQKDEEKPFSSVRPKRYNKKLKLEDGEKSTCLNIDIEQSAGISQNETLDQDTNIIFEEDKQNIDDSEPLLDQPDLRVLLEGLLNDTTVSHIEDDGDLIDASGSNECNENLDSDIEDDIDNQNEETEKEEKNCDQDQPIYEGHSMTVGVSVLLILLYSIAHGISGSQLNDLLTLIGLHCMNTHPGLKSLFHFKNQFATIKSPLVKHYYCGFCLSCVTETDENCPNTFCGKNLTSDNKKSKCYFIEVPIESQLHNFFKRPEFPKLIKHRFSRKKSSEENIEDIYDGEVYRKLSSKGGLLSDANPYNISFTLNTDGVPLFKSSKFSIWPVYMMINELPFKHRKQSENMVFCGLWFGDSKPLMATFLKPIHKSLRRLEEEGLVVSLGEEDIICKAFLICITADLPARSLLMNMNQFNGAYSCAKCLEKGETFKTSKGGSVHIFPFNRHSPQGTERTMKDSVESAVEATNIKNTVRGIKGPSFLMALKYFDYVKGASIDCMHGVFLGVTKLLIKLWFSSGCSKEDFSISHYSEVIDKRLLEIKPPSFITRVPRSLSTHFPYWKASELRSWLFFYSLPLLLDILPESYYLHYASFVQAIHLLCGKSISPEAISKAKGLLMYFVISFSSLYGERYQTLNIHQLIHLSQCVQQLGPLWTYSCFSFENANGDITKLFHGTQNVELQIISSVNIIQHLPSLIDAAPNEYKSIIQKFCSNRVAKHIASFHVQFLGKSYKKFLTDDIMQQVTVLLNYEVPNIEFYSRVLLRGEVYHSKDYKRVVKRNSYTVKYFCQDTKLMRYGYILCFGNQKGSETAKCFAFILETDEQACITSNISFEDKLKINVSHIHCVKGLGSTKVVEINNIICVCANVSYSGVNVTYICEPPNSYETD